MLIWNSKSCGGMWKVEMLCVCTPWALQWHQTAHSSFGGRQIPASSAWPAHCPWLKIPFPSHHVVSGWNSPFKSYAATSKWNCACDLCHLIFMNGKENSDTKITYLIPAHPLCWPPSHTALGAFPPPSVGQSNFCWIHFLRKVHEVRVSDYEKHVNQNVNFEIDTDTEGPFYLLSKLNFFLQDFQASLFL